MTVVLPLDEWWVRGDVLAFAHERDQAPAVTSVNVIVWARNADHAPEVVRQEIEAERRLWRAAWLGTPTVEVAPEALFEEEV